MVAAMVVVVVVDSLPRWIPECMEYAHGFLDAVVLTLDSFDSL